MRRNEIMGLFVPSIALAVLLSVLILVGTVDVPQAIQIIITFVLVLITYIYVLRTAEIAKATKEQAKASVKMAEEMSKQRYDALRPIIDFEPYSPILNRLSITSKQELVSEGFGCIIRNIGVGPAIDGHTFIRDSISHERSIHGFGTRVPKDSTYPLSLSFEEENGKTVLVAQYRDVYGRGFASKRKLEGQPGAWKLGHLEVTEDRSNDKRIN